MTGFRGRTGAAHADDEERESASTTTAERVLTIRYLRDAT
jgi:hypothetical protein